MRDDQFTILLVEDDPNDVAFLKRAFKRTGVLNPVQTVSDGEQAIAYLSGIGPFADRATYPFPRIMITDLKMPKVSGIDLLQWMHQNPKIRVIPTIVLTSSTDQDDVSAAFLNGANAYMIKPVSFQDLEKTVRAIADYWRLSLVPAR